MGKILKEKAIDREIQGRDSVINFTNKNSEPDISILQEFYGKKLFEIEEILIDKLTLNSTFYNQVLNIFNKTNDIFNDKGIHTLYIAWDFIKFDHRDDSSIKKELNVFEAPLFLAPVKITFAASEQLNLEIEKKIIINKKLINFLKESTNTDKKIELNENMSVEQFSNLMYNTFPLIRRSEKYTGIYLGSFDPYEKKIKTEIRAIANMDINLYEAKPIYSRNDYIEQEFVNEPLLVINNPLNFYQKIAVRSALNENTIIYGPPGTGKSEIIVNIIANSIVNEKTLLVTCEKKTALDVLLERLGYIEKLCLFLNSIDDEDIVYKKIIDIQELLGLTWFTKTHHINKDEDNENQTTTSMELHETSLKSMIYDLNSIKAFSKRTLEFYDKIKTSINLDFISKTSLDFSSYQQENKALLNELSIIDGWDELIKYKNKVFGQNESIWTLITRIYYYDQFKKEYMLDDYIINEYFQQIDEFNLVKTKSLFAKKEDLNLDFNKRYLEFFNIIESINIIKDKEFFVELSSDYFIFERQMKLMIKIHEKYPHIVSDDEFMNFLINNASKHKEFVSTISEIPEYYRFTALNKYLTEGIIKRKGFKIKNFKNTSLLKDKYDVINLFSTLTLPKNCEYLLNNPFDIWKFLTADLVFFYMNEKMKSEEMNFLIQNDIIRAEKRFCDIVTKTGISSCIQRIKKLSQFEEVNIKNKEFSDKTMNSYIVQFYKENSQNIETISETIYVKYIDWLRNKLSKCDENFKRRTIEMFQVSKVPNGSNRMKITTFIKRYEDILKLIFPIWIGSPNDVSNFSKFERGIFDIAIIDESSQMLMENALPVLYRAKHYVVAGDDKQLKATVAFSKKYKNNERLDYQTEMDFDIVESLLDRANVALWNNFILRNHYRSEKQELISFSNEYIYNNQLIFATKNRKNTKAIEVINVKDGYYIDSVNKKEAEVVIDVLSKAIASNEYTSFLIITFSANQSEYIQKLIVQSEESSKFNELMTTNRLKVRNLENAQGFEADCVILSVSHAKKDEDSKLKSSFGPLIQDGGMNRLNVAITRAKSKMYVVKSMYAHEMSINKENKNLMTFYYFINYLDNIEEHYQSLIQVKRNKKVKYKYGNEIIDYIKKHINPNIKYTCQHKLGNFMADVVFYSEDLNNIELILCLDYWSKYNEPSELLTNINTQEYLMSIGYDFIRIKELEWEFNKVEVIKNLDLMIEKINQRFKENKTKTTTKTKKKAPTTKVKKEKTKSKTTTKKITVKK